MIFRKTFLKTIANLKLNVTSGKTGIKVQKITLQYQKSIRQKIVLQLDSTKIKCPEMLHFYKQT